MSKRKQKRLVLEYHGSEGSRFPGWHIKDGGPSGAPIAWIVQQDNPTKEQAERRKVLAEELVRKVNAHDALVSRLLQAVESIEGGKLGWEEAFLKGARKALKEAVPPLPL
jgi:hypothetical protein